MVSTMPSDIPTPADFNPSDYRILVVDDDSALLDLMKLILGRTGFQVETALNPPPALELLETEHFDLLILDDMMPVMDGYEMLKRLRADHRWDNMPIVMCGGRADQAYADMVVQAGVDAHLIKPVLFHELIAKITELLTRGRARTSTSDGKSRVR